MQTKSLFSLLTVATTLTMAMIINTPAATVLDGTIAAADERFVFHDDATAGKDGVAVDTTAAEGEWHEFLASVPEKVKLESGKCYCVSYDYTIKKVKNGDTKFYQLLRTGDDNTKDQAMDQWTAKEGDQGHKEFVVGLKHPGYRLILGVRFGGALVVKNLKIEDVSPAPPPPGFLLSGPITPDERLVLQHNAAVVKGGVEVDTTASPDEWHEYLSTAADTVTFESGKSYSIAYDYAVVKVKDSSTEFYHLLRTGSDTDKDQGWETWTDTAGTKGHKELTVNPSETGYRLILGVHYGGAIRIENLKIEDLSKKK